MESLERPFTVSIFTEKYNRNAQPHHHHFHKKTLEYRQYNRVETEIKNVHRYTIVLNNDVKNR